MGCLMPKSLVSGVEIVAMLNEDTKIRGCGVDKPREKRREPGDACRQVDCHGSCQSQHLVDGNNYQRG